MKRLKHCDHKKKQIEVKKFVLTAIESSVQKRILTGLAAHIEVSGEVQCGGAVVSQSFRAKAVNSRNISQKYIWMNKMER